MKTIKIEQEIIQFRNKNNQIKQAIKINGLVYSSPNTYDVKWVSIDAKNYWSNVSKDEFKQLVEVIE